MAIGPLPQGTATFVGLTGAPLSGGKVFTYVVATTTPKATWQDPQQVSLNANPVPLNANGQAVIYGWGTYRLLVQDSLGNTISDSVTTGGPLTQTVTVFRNQSGNFTVPAGVYQLYVEVIGGGGGGSGCGTGSATGNVSGGGGGAGGFASSLLAVTPAQVIAYVASATTGVGSQATGGTSSFGSITCNGGGGASFGSTGTSVGGIGGTASGGNIINLSGGNGTDGSHIPPSGGAPYVGSGNGGASRYGQGGTAVNGAAGNSGTPPGSGGGGAMDVNLTGAHFNGGGGAAGLVLISYWS